MGEAKSELSIDLGAALELGQGFAWPPSLPFKDICGNEELGVICYSAPAMNYNLGL